MVLMLFIRPKMGLSINFVGVYQEDVQLGLRDVFNRRGGGSVVNKLPRLALANSINVYRTLNVSQPMFYCTAPLLLIICYFILMPDVITGGDCSRDRIVLRCTFLYSTISTLE